MIDFHTHVLPGMDDGAKTPAIAIEMLGDSHQQGVDTIVSTSHCYVSDPESIQNFLARRAECYKTLCGAIAACDQPLPEIRLGAEVHMKLDFSAYPDLDMLCIEGTNYILIEMPYGKWHPQLYDCLYSLKLKGLRPVLAHIDRYPGHEKDFYNLRDLDLLYQVNADSFLRFPERRFMAKLYGKNMIHVLGSDMHDPVERVSHIREAAQTIRKKYGADLLGYLEQNAHIILENGKVIQKRFPPLGFWDKIRL